APPPPATATTRQAPTVASPPPTPAVVAVAPASAKATAVTRHTPAELKAIRRTILPDVVRIAIELDREVEYRSDQIDDPDRVFVDLHTTSVAASVDASQTFEEELVKAIRLGPRPGGTTRVVVDLERSAHYSVFTLYNPYRIVVDVNRPGGSVPAVIGTANAGAKSDKVVRASDAEPPALETLPIAPAAPVL